MLLGAASYCPRILRSCTARSHDALSNHYVTTNAPQVSWLEQRGNSGLVRPSPHMGRPGVFEAINWNKIQDDRNLEVWDRLTQFLAA